MAFNINEMRSQLVYGGARQNLFQVRINNPANAAGDLKTPFMVQAAQIPESTLGVIPVFYFGRQMKLAGDRTFGDWTVTVLNDEDFLIRNAMEEWSNRINRLERNVRDINRYKSNATVIQYAKDGTKIREYRFDGLFPSVISPIDLDWSATDQLESFQVTFSYDYWTVSGGTTNDAGGR
jgi:hypothetical protein